MATEGHRIELAKQEDLRPKEENFRQPRGPDLRLDRRARLGTGETNYLELQLEFRGFENLNMDPKPRLMAFRKTNALI